MQHRAKGAKNASRGIFGVSAKDTFSTDFFRPSFVLSTAQWKRRVGLRPSQKDPNTTTYSAMRLVCYVIIQQEHQRGRGRKNAECGRRRIRYFVYAHAGQRTLISPGQLTHAWTWQNTYAIDPKFKSVRNRTLKVSHPQEGLTISNSPKQKANSKRKHEVLYLNRRDFVGIHL